MTTKRTTPAQAIKAALKVSFPTTKFSCIYKSYSGGDSVNVYYTDGPAYEDVNKICKRYQAGDFNGMEDIYEYSSNCELNSAKYVFVNREISREIESSIRKHVESYFNWDHSDFQNQHHENRAYYDYINSFDFTSGTPDFIAYKTKEREESDARWELRKKEIESEQNKRITMIYSIFPELKIEPETIEPETIEPETIEPETIEPAYVEHEESEVPATYSKYAPNVWLAKTASIKSFGDTIEVANKYGKTTIHIVHKLIYSKAGYNYYSTERTGESYAERRAKRYESASIKTEHTADSYYSKSNKDRDFLVLGEPIKIGHHSERKHRKAFEDARLNMRNYILNLDKAREQERKSEYWKMKCDEINLSSPESIDFYTAKLEKAIELQLSYKSGERKQEHSFSLTYATKAVKDLKEKVELAKKLWE